MKRLAALAFAAIERHPLQLHETERREYLEMKRREYSRQQAKVAVAYDLP